MRSGLRFSFLLALLLLVSADSFGQKTDSVTPPADDATLEEVQKWLSGALVKYGSYKTRVSTVDISNVRFEGCSLKYAITRKSGSTSTAVMGATRTVNTAKDEISIDGAMMARERVLRSAHVYPELETIQIGFNAEQVNGLSNYRLVELVVKSEAAKGLQRALIQFAHNCEVKKSTHLSSRLSGSFVIAAERHFLFAAVRRRNLAVGLRPRWGRHHITSRSDG